MNEIGDLVFIIALIAAIVLALALMRFSRQFLLRHSSVSKDQVKPVKIGGVISPTFTFFRLISQRIFHRIAIIKIVLPQWSLPKLTLPKLTLPKLTLPRLTLPRLTLPKLTWPKWSLPKWSWSTSWVVIIEILAVIIWAIYVGRAFLDFDSTFWPRGNEFSFSVRDNFFWQDLTRCGSCALWDGRTAGGFPALVDLQGAPLHPLFIFPTLFFGVVNGGKVAVVLALALAGLAQLWLGHLMKLGWAARLWAAGMAVVAGTLTGRMEMGLTTLVVSTASGALVIPAGINLAQKPSWRAAILLAGALSLTMLAGQGYTQIGVLLAILPALLILYFGPRQRMIDLLKKLVFASGLTLLFSGVMLFPLAHNSSAMAKDTDPAFQMAQPIDYQLLNLVIHDGAYYQTDILGKGPFPYVFSNFIGWTPILFALFAIRMVPIQKYRLVIFFLVGIALVYLNSSMILPKLLFENTANEFLVGLRNMPLITGLAGPLILGLAAWGLDLVSKENWLVISLNWKYGSINDIRLPWILLAVLMVSSIMSVNQFNAAWLDTVKSPDPERQTVMQIKTDTTQWTTLPAENFWNLLVFENDMKLTNSFHPWHFKNIDLPGGFIEGVREDWSKPVGEVFFRAVGIAFTKIPANDYSALMLRDGSTLSCPAYARGGWIEVNCPNNAGGELVVKEHNWSGWAAYVDAQPFPIVIGQWLKLYIPEGKHTIVFRYQPWDVPLGLIAFLGGIGLAGIVWRRDRKQNRVEV
jgi:hypothetical protein